MSDEINDSNVDQAINDAIKKYFELGMLVDALFWKHCIRLLRSREKSKLK